MRFSVMEAEFLPKAKGFRTYATTIFLHFLMNRNLVISPSSFTWKAVIRVDIAREICAEIFWTNLRYLDLLRRST
jgi:hypothetical protein